MEDAEGEPSSIGAEPVIKAKMVQYEKRGCIRSSRNSRWPPGGMRAEGEPSK